MAEREYEPMLASNMKPGNWPPDPNRQIVQPKWNGIRALGHRAVRQLWQGHSEERVRIMTRGGNDYTDRFPALAHQLPWALQGNEAVVDGEIVRFFGPNNQHDHNTVYRRGGRLVYYVFDILELNRKPLIYKPWEYRNDTLMDLLVPQENIQMTPSFATVDDLFDEMHDWDLEGIIVKDKRSTYKPGSRSQAWQKLKFKPDVS